MAWSDAARQAAAEARKLKRQGRSAYTREFNRVKSLPAREGLFKMIDMSYALRSQTYKRELARMSTLRRGTNARAYSESKVMNLARSLGKRSPI